MAEKIAGKIDGITCWELEFDAAGRLPRNEGLTGGAERRELSDLIIFSHGWNKSVGGARSLYRAMIGLIAGVLPPGRRDTTGFAGVLWPSLLFPEDEAAPAGRPTGGGGMTHSAGPAPAGPAAPGGPGGLAAAPARTEQEPSTGNELATALAPAFPGQEDALGRLGALLDGRPQDFERLKEFHALAAALVTAPAEAPEDSGERPLLSAPTRRVMETMAGLAPAAGGDAQSANPFDDLWRGARELLRTLSYFEMKNRAGVIGRTGLGRFLTELHAVAPDLRVHLIGHSFGARLVSFGLAGLPPSMPAGQSPVKSLFLIQAAFSHFSFASKLPFDPARSGALAAVAHLVDGPALATFSAADRAVGWWYPNASRISRADAEATADFDFRWGGLGHDGFQHDDVVALTLGPPGTTKYDLRRGGFYRLDANHVICMDQSRFSGAHSDIRHKEVAWAAVSAAGLTERT